MTANQAVALVTGASVGMGKVISPIRPPGTPSGDFRANPFSVTIATGAMP